jgi:uncharacterized SAM-binding protein YcdF (DUF218 family)
LVLFVFRAPLLNGAARAWMINDLPVKADAIVVLGGGAQFRSFEAVRLYHAGLAPTILLMNSELRATDRMGLTIPEVELVRRILLSNAVPAAVIQVAGTNLTSTFEEAKAARDWSRAAHATSMLIPTGPFHSRRVRWAFRKNLGDTVRTTITSIRPEECRGWWTDEKALLDFQNELLKFALYRLRY